MANGGPKTRSYSVFYEHAPEGGYAASVPALPGCYTKGETLEEAEHNIKEAIGLYLDSLVAHSEEVPEHGSSFQGTVTIPDSIPLPAMIRDANFLSRSSSKSFELNAAASSKRSSVPRKLRRTTSPGPKSFPPCDCWPGLRWRYFAPSPTWSPPAAPPRSQCTTKIRARGRSRYRSARSPRRS